KGLMVEEGTAPSRGYVFREKCVDPQEETCAPKCNLFERDTQDALGLSSNSVMNQSRCVLDRADISQGTSLGKIRTQARSTVTHELQTSKRSHELFVKRLSS